MDNWLLLWIAWMAAFGVIEYAAVMKKRAGDPKARTLTDLLQRLIRWRVGSLDVGRFGLAAGFLWLIGHLFGWW